MTKDDAGFLESIKDVELLSVSSALKRIAIHQAYLDSLSPTIIGIDDLERRLASIKDRIEKSRVAISGKLQAAQTISSSLESYQKQIDEKQTELEAGRKKLAQERLSQEELAILLSSQHPIIEEKFQMALQKLNSVFPFQRDDLAHVKEACYPRLWAWFETNVGNLSVDFVEQYQIEAIFSFLALVDEEGLRRDFVAARSTKWEGCFYQRFRGSGPLSHSMVRRTTDMLAWYHETFLEESRLIKIVFSGHDGGLVDCLLPVTLLVARCIEEMTLAQAIDPGAALNLLLVTAYYEEWVGGRAEADDTLLQPIKDLTKHLNHLVNIVVNQEIDLLRLNPTFDQHSLTPGEPFQLFTKHIVTLLSVYRKSLGPTTAAGLYKQVQGKMVAAFVTEIGKLSFRQPIEASIFYLNAVYYVRTLTNDDEFVGSRLTEPIDSHIQSLADGVRKDLLRTAMLPEAIVEGAQIDDEAVIEVAGNLSETIVIHSGWDWNRMLGKVQFPAYKDRAVRLARQSILTLYEGLWERSQTATAGQDEKGRMKDPKTFAILLSPK